MGFISDNYGVAQTTPLMTDKYHFTTAQAYWREGRADNPSIFYMFGRKEAQGGGYTVAAGLEGVIDIIKRWQEFGLSDDDIAYLRTLKTRTGRPEFSEGFLTYLKNMEFKLKIDAAPEGSVFFPQEPVLRVEGPLAQAKILESVALGLINGHSAYITHASRLTNVLQQEQKNGSPKGTASVQGLRRGPSLGAALESSRSLGAGGYTSTSTGTAAKQFGQTFVGTMDHAWIMTHKNELNKTALADLYKLEEKGQIKKFQQALSQDAFRSYAMAYPDGGIFLVDTYHPLQGLENAITVMKEIRALGNDASFGVRFDSGDIVEYSKIALRRYAEEGFITGIDPADVKNMTHERLLLHSDKCNAFCAAADGIDENTAKEMREAGGFFKSWGVGTSGSHIPPLGLVYKASSVFMDDLEQGGKMTPVMKVASNAPFKSSNPGKINSQRHYDADGMLSHVVLFDEDLRLDAEGRAVNLRTFDDVGIPEMGTDISTLLVPVFDVKGRYVYEEPARIESFPGSGKLVTDLAAIAGDIREAIDKLPDNVRQVTRPPDEVLAKILVPAFRAEQKAGKKKMVTDIDETQALLPPEMGHILVFLDKNLYEQRLAVEARHLGHVNKKGVGEYTERFNGGEDSKKKPKNNRGGPVP